MQWQLIFLFFTGLVSGFINTLAGGGSGLNLPMMIFLGIDPIVANGTNRLAITAQTLTGIAKFKSHDIHDFKLTKFAAPFVFIGALAGSWYSTTIDPQVFKKLLGFVIIGVAAITLINPFRYFKEHSTHFLERPGFTTKKIIAAFVFLLIGLYGGLIQVGIGFVIMIVIRILTGANLVEVNAIKVSIAFFFAVTALAIFGIKGLIHWPAALILTAGMSLGAYTSAHLGIKKGDRFVKIVPCFS